MTKHKISRIIFSFVCLSSMSWGCAYNGNMTKQQAMNGKIQLPATMFNKDAVLPEYKLGFGDVIEIKFPRQPEFNEIVTVRPDGRISLVRIGEFFVSGMTSAELDSFLTAGYGEFLWNPDLTVILREFGGYKVYVLGEVDKPGGVEIQKNMTVLQAVAEAGGATNRGQLGSVMVIRRAEGRKIQAIRLNLNNSLKPKDALDVVANDIFLQPHDIIYVPKTFFGNIASFMEQIYDGFLPPVEQYIRYLFLVDRRNN